MQNLIKDDFKKLEMAIYEKSEKIEDIPVNHTFIDGVYTRHGELIKGQLYIGHEHKLECINILAQGKLLLKNNMEDEGVIITAPHTFVTQPGNRKLGYALENGYMYNIFRTDETDIDKLNNEVLAVKSETYIKHKESLWLE